MSSSIIGCLAAKVPPSVAQSSTIGGRSSPILVTAYLPRRLYAGHNDPKGTSPDTSSTQSPVSQGGEHISGAHSGEEKTSTDEQVKNRPEISPAEKRRNVEKAGQKSMGPEDEEARGAAKHHIGT